MDPDNKDQVERLNRRAGKFDDRSSYPKNLSRGKPGYSKVKSTFTRFLSKKYRSQVFSLIKEKMKPEGHIIQFHTIKEELFKPYLCRHIWIKGLYAGLSGSPDFNNGEYINIIGPEFKKDSNSLAKYIAIDFPSKNGGIVISRACAKPLKLWDLLYYHLKSKYILDPFAGYGLSIKSALDLGLKIDACDLDDTVNWSFEKKEALESFF